MFGHHQQYVKGFDRGAVALARRSLMYLNELVRRDVCSAEVHMRLHNALANYLHERGHLPEDESL